MKTHSRSFGRALAALLAGTVVAHAAQAETAFAELSLEELLDEPITSASKHPMRRGDAAAAVTVITDEDIRRFGVRTLADALRLAPGMHVARVNSHAWAVSARGFQGTFADKLLVMIDGRTVYEPIFAGVNWSTQDLVLEDLERIEVIRGPGATLWGANAVNGVVNIITKHAADSQGTLVSSTVSAEDRPGLTVRQGGTTAGGANYRVYMKYFEREGLQTSTGADANDDWRALRGGFRFDKRSAAGDLYLLEGDVFHGRVTENVSEPLLTPPYESTFRSSGDELGGNVLGRWTHSLSDTSQLTLQSFFSRSQVRIIGGDVRADTFDLDLQHQLKLSARQTIVWGAGFRMISDQNQPTRQVLVTPQHRTTQLYSGFVQDEISLVPKRLQLTLGAKLEHNRVTGFETQPGIRLAWTPSGTQTVWSSVSRAVRTPARFETDGRLAIAAFPTGPGAPPALVSLVSNPDFQAEELLAYEIGYRIEPTPQIALDVATFYNNNDHVIGFTRTTVDFNSTAQPPYLAVSLNGANARGGSSYGAEFSLLWNVAERVHLSADYTWFRIPFLEGNNETFDSARHLAHVRAHVTLPWQVELTSALSYTGRLSSSNVGANLQLDIGVILHPASWLEIGVWGQSLLDKQHQEFVDLHTSVVTEVPRSVLLKVSSRF